MVVSIYNELIQYEEVGGDMIRRVEDLHVYHLFEPLHSLYGEDLEMFDKALFFILHAYSIGSKFHIIGQDWGEIKERIAKRVGITRESPYITRVKGKETVDVLLYDDLVLLNNEQVLDAIRRYLDFQGNRNFKHLCMLKEQYEQFVSGSVDPLKKKGSDEIDFEQKNKNRAYATKTLEEINEWEQKVVDTMGDLKHAMVELQKKQSERMPSLRIEDNLT